MTCISDQLLYYTLVYMYIMTLYYTVYTSYCICELLATYYIKNDCMSSLRTCTCSSTFQRGGIHGSTLVPQLLQSLVIIIMHDSFIMDLRL